MSAWSDLYTHTANLFTIDNTVGGTNILTAAVSPSIVTVLENISCNIQTYYGNSSFGDSARVITERVVVFTDIKNFTDNSVAVPSPGDFLTLSFDGYTTYWEINTVDRSGGREETVELTCTRRRQG